MQFNVNSEFLCKAMKIAEYKHNEETKTSYDWQDGAKILPGKLCISREIISPIKNTGKNNSFNIVGQLFGRFKKAEQSPLKQGEGRIRTRIAQIPFYPIFIGYGTLGYGIEFGKKADTDLIVLYTNNNWDNIIIFYLPGLADALEGVMPELSKYVKWCNYDIEQIKGNASQHIPSKVLQND